MTELEKLYAERDRIRQRIAEIESAGKRREFRGVGVTIVAWEHGLADPNPHLVDWGEVPRGYYTASALLNTARVFAEAAAHIEGKEDQCDD